MPGAPGFDSRQPDSVTRMIHVIANNIKTLTTLIALFLISGCQMTSLRNDHGMKFGPAPPGYERIVGEPVPGWTPQDMMGGNRQAGDPLMQWDVIGPKPILDEFWSGNDDASGRVVSIATHPTNPDIVYIASASGGMWKTTDGGATWVPKTDELSILNHGHVALDPSNPETVYLGTGEYTMLSSGDGLFRSTDGGTTFTRIGTTAEVGNQCSKIKIDPTNSDIIHLTGRGGYVRSVDGGANWETPLTGSCSDLALNPNDPSIVYVARHGTGVYKSTDGGASFTQLTNGLPSSGVNRIVMAMADSNPSVLYVAIINGSSGLLGMYKTTDAGASWTQLTNTPNFPSPQGWYDCFVGVDPTDEDAVYAGGVFPTYAVAGVIRTTNGGASWTDITIGGNGVQLHPDQHAIGFGPDGEMWIGNDGGVWSSVDGGQTWLNHNNQLTVTQNYSIAVHPNNPALVTGGTQDNGTVGRDLGTDQWPQVLGGDGGFLAYDFDSPTRRYTTYVYLTVYRISAGGSATNISGPWSGDPKNFIAPLVMDPSDSRTLLGGTNRVWRTTSASTSATWTAISTSSVSGGGRLNAIAVGPDTASPSNNIYTGSTNGRVFFTSNGSTWSDRSSGLPGSGVSDIMVSPVDEADAYVSFFRSTGGRVYKTTNTGMSWINVTGSLPTGVTPRAMAIDWEFNPPGIYVGSGAGVYVSLDNGVTWTKDGADLPNVNIGDLFIDFERAEITAGTFGRGAWRSPLARPPSCFFDDDCDDNLFCNGDESCVGGQCEPGTPPCQAPLTCSESLDECVSCVADADCDDGVFCNGDEACVDALCIPGENPCPDQFCDDGLGACVECLLDEHCVDTDECTDDACVGGTCDHFSVLCLPPDQCDPEDGQCKECLSNADCSGGQTCVLPDGVCGGCVNDQACDDQNPCTDDACVASTCRNEANFDPCDDGIYCNGDDHCADATCSQHSGSPCQTGQTCVEELQVCGCVVDSDCDDDNDCTDDACLGNQCQHVNNTGPCDDGAFCNGEDTCADGVCSQHGGSPCDDDNPCTDDTCVADQCSHVDNNNPCDDGLFCNGDDTCVDGACAHGGIPCEDGYACIEATATCCPADCIDGDLCDCPPCTNNADCNHGNVCEFSACIDNACRTTKAAYADVAGAGGTCGPDGQINLSDILALLDGFQGIFSEGCEFANMNIAGSGGSCEPDDSIDLSDILAALDAFQGDDPCCTADR